MRLNNKVVLITASTRGIGLACVKACAMEGAIVYMAARNLELAEEISADLCNQGYKVKYVYNEDEAETIWTISFKVKEEPMH